MKYRFGTYRFDDRSLALTRSDRPVPIEPQPARALALLVARAGEVITRDEMRAHLWEAGTHVDFEYAFGDRARDAFVVSLQKNQLMIARVGAVERGLVRRDSTRFMPSAVPARRSGSNATGTASSR